jgi:hypothetical protein
MLLHCEDQMFNLKVNQQYSESCEHTVVTAQKVMTSSFLLYVVKNKVKFFLCLTN